MNNGKACTIFRNIDSDQYTDSEKGMAILTVMLMPDMGSITKSDMAAVIRWMWSQIFEIEVGDI